MTQLPPASLLRLKEGDVVRLCGLVAAANGLVAAARHEVREARRTGARLEAVIGDGPGSRVCVEVTDDGAPTLSSWECSRDPQVAAGETDAPAQLGCMHVAAVLTAWIRAPADFATPAPPEMAEQSTTEEEATATPAPIDGRGSQLRLEQPRLLDGGGRRMGGAARHSLADELGRLSSAEVVATARRVLGVEPNEREARALLAAALAEPKRVGALVERLDADARALLGDILLMGGAITTADLDARAQRTGGGASVARAEAAVLERHALMFRSAGTATGQGGAERSFRQVAGWRIPPETRQALSRLRLPFIAPLAAPRGLPEVPGASAAEAADAGAAIHGTGAGGQRGGTVRVVRGSPRQVALALALLARAPAPYNPFLARGERGAVSHATDGARERTEFPPLATDLPSAALAAFARGANVPRGVARLARRVLLWSRESGADGGLRDLATVPPGEREVALRAGFRSWRGAEEPAELADLALPELPVRVRFDMRHAALRPAAVAAEAAAARDFVLRVLEGLQPGDWYALDDLLALLWRIHPLFLRGRQQTYTTPAWWIERVADVRPLRATVRHEWVEAEGAYVRELLAGPLYWWGAVDLAVGAASTPLAFRLTAFGAYLLGIRDGVDSTRGSPPSGDGGPAVVITRERRMAVQPLAATGALLGALDNWAEVSAVAGGRLIYSLAPGRAAAAFDAGATYDGLERALRSSDAGGARAAEAVAEQLHSWREKYGRTRIERGCTLVEAQDEAALTEALAYAPEIASRCRRLGPAVAVADPADGAALRDILQRRGYAL